MNKLVFQLIDLFVAFVYFPVIFAILWRLYKKTKMLEAENNILELISEIGELKANEKFERFHYYSLKMLAFNKKASIIIRLLVIGSVWFVFSWIMSFFYESKPWWELIP